VLKPKHSAKWPAQVSSAASLPSAKVLALGKDLKVCRVQGSSTRQSNHVAGPWRGHFAECQTRTLGKALAQGGAMWLLYRVSRHSAKPLPSARNPTLGKVNFAVRVFTECRLPSVTLGKDFAEWDLSFAECN